MNTSLFRKSLALALAGTFFLGSTGTFAQSDAFQALLGRLQGWQAFLKLGPTPTNIQIATDGFRDYLNSGKSIAPEDIIDCRFRVVPVMEYTIPTLHREICRWGCGNSGTSHFVAWDIEYLNSLMADIKKKLGVSVQVQLLTENPNASSVSWDEVMGAIHTRKSEGSLSRDFEISDEVKKNVVWMTKSQSEIKAENAAYLREQQKQKQLGQVRHRRKTNHLVQDSTPEATIPQGEYAPDDGDYGSYRYNYRLIFPNGKKGYPGQTVTIDGAAISCVAKNNEQHVDAPDAQFKSSFHVSDQETNQAKQFLTEKHPVFSDFSANAYHYLMDAVNHRYQPKISYVDLREEIYKAFAEQLAKVSPDVSKKWSVCDWTVPRTIVKGTYQENEDRVLIENRLRSSGVYYFDFKESLDTPTVSDFRIRTTIPESHYDIFAEDVGLMVKLTEEAERMPLRSLWFNHDTFAGKQLATHLKDSPYIPEERIHAGQSTDQVGFRLSERDAHAGTYEFSRLDIKVMNCR